MNPQLVIDLHTALQHIHTADFGMSFLWAIAMLVVSTAAQMLITPKAQKPEKATLKDFDFPQFEEGTPQPVIFGDCWTQDFFVAWYGNLRTSAIKSSGGKK